MGHANISNLSDLWVNLLYAKGKLTIGQAVEVAERRGETLHASEGEYDAESGMVAYAFEEVADFQSCDAGAATSKYGWRGKWAGPFIEAALELDVWAPKRFRPDRELALLFTAHLDAPQDATVYAATADRIEELGLADWAAFVRDLLKISKAYELWNENDDAYHDGDDWWEYLHRVPWRFCKGKRAGYRDVPRLGNITN